MSEQKHTPGPWHCCINASHTAFLIKDKKGRLIAMPSWHTTDDTNFPLKPQSEANSKLMAAAPELLEALKQSAEGWANAIELKLLPPQHVMSASILRDSALAAIAKATGR